MLCQVSDKTLFTETANRVYFSEIQHNKTYCVDWFQYDSLMRLPKGWLLTIECNECNGNEFAIISFCIGLALNLAVFSLRMIGTVGIVLVLAFVFVQVFD